MRLPLDKIRDCFRTHNDLFLVWRATLPDRLKWLDGDEVPSGLSEAWLRAKYYEAMYRINRPHLDFALNILPHLRDGRGVREVAVNMEGKRREEGEVRLLEAIDGLHMNEVEEACHQCIKAATQTVTAFDRVCAFSLPQDIYNVAYA